jgi:hypothetical protein
VMLSVSVIWVSAAILGMHPVTPLKG